MRISLAILPVILFVAAATVSRSAAARTDGPRPLPNTALALPAVKGITAEWVLFSQEDAARSELGHFHFAVDAKGEFWFADGARGLLIAPRKDYAVLSDQPFSDFSWMEDGDPIICTKKAVGFLSLPDTPQKRDGDLPVATFVPLVPISYGNCRIFLGGAGALYLVERNPADGNHEIFLLRVENGKPDVVKLVSSDHYVGAVAGDGTTTFFASGNWIIRVTPEKKELEWYFEAKQEITGLQYSRKAGLFYTTPNGVGFADPRFPLQFLKAPGPEIALRASDLYIRLPHDFVVLKITGADRFGEARWPDANSGKSRQPR